MAQGVETSLFVKEVLKDFVCAICAGVFYDPYTTPCDHIFCKDCVCEWLTQQSNCPTCRNPMTNPQLRRTSRIIRNMISELELKCPYHMYGCRDIITMAQLDEHESNCLFDPIRKTRCPICSCDMTFAEKQTHICPINLLKLNEDLKIQNRRLLYEVYFCRTLIVLFVFQLCYHYFCKLLEWLSGES